MDWVDCQSRGAVMDCRSGEFQVALPVLFPGENPPEPAVTPASLCQLVPVCASQAYFICGHLLIPPALLLQLGVGTAVLMRTFLVALLLGI